MIIQKSTIVGSIIPKLALKAQAWMDCIGPIGLRTAASGEQEQTPS